MDTVKPCCQPAVLEGFHVRHYERICFVFGQGLCQPFYKIPKIKLYVQLVKQLNSTNYMELRRTYRRNLDIDSETEMKDSRLFRLGMSDDDAEIVYTDTRKIPLQMVRNDTATKLPDSNSIPEQKVRNDTRTKLTDSDAIPTPMVRHETATKSTEVAAIPVQMVGNKKITMRKTEYHSPPAIKLPIPNRPTGPKAWSRYKCTGGYCNRIAY